MTETWDGEKGRFWAEHADWFSRMLGGFGEVLIEGAALQPGERVLDVGSGGGDMSIAAGTAVGPDGEVVGVDLSADEIAVAVHRVADRGLENVRFELGDASAIDLEPGFDVLLSRFGVMFFDDSPAAFTHLRSLLADDGRLAFVAWTRQADNGWITLAQQALATVVTLAPPPPPGSPGGFAFADGDHVRRLLDEAGFRDVELEEVSADVDFGSDPDEAVRFVRSMEYARLSLDEQPEDVQEAATVAMRDALAAQRGRDGMRFPGWVWLVRARA